MMQTRALTYLSLGVAAGVLGSKIVPLVASARAARKARMGSDPFERLVDDHRVILRTLDDMVDVPSDASGLRRGKLLFQLKRRLAKHAMAEEDVIYPAIHDAHAAQSDHLYNEHAAMKRLLFELEQSVATGHNWRTNAEELRALIRQHAQEEEEQVFPQLRQETSREKLPELSSGIAREEAMVL